MTSKLNLFVAGLAGVLVCSVAGAQSSKVRSPVSIQRPVARHVSVTARSSAGSAGSASPGAASVRQASVIRIFSSGGIASGSVPIWNSFSFDNTSGVPGLGFDFPHLAAISGGLGSNSSSRFGQGSHRGQGSFVPILFGGYPYYYDDVGSDQAEQQPVQPSQPQPQIIVIQQPVPAQQGADAGSDTGNVSAPAPEAQADLPVRDVGDFILVRRDGRILFASIFSVVGSQLLYVTPEGIRRTLDMSDLDSDATERMNEARGTTVQIHN